MARHAKTIRMIEEAQLVLTKHHPMTVRQVYYQLVSRQVREKERQEKEQLVTALRGL